jgi:putative (di)nucleoside polyphosphate hydrolase
MAEAEGLAAAPEGYRRGVGIVLVNHERRIFLGERRGPLLNAWQMPQGGIDPGETPAEAAARELAEEVGTDKASLIAETAAWYAYDLPKAIAARAWKGRFRGQAQKWFLFRFEGHDADIDLEAHEPEFSAWRWATPDEVLEAAWDVKLTLYQAVLAEFREHLA